MLSALKAMVVRVAGVYVALFWIWLVLFIVATGIGWVASAIHWFAWLFSLPFSLAGLCVVLPFALMYAFWEVYRKARKPMCTVPVVRTVTGTVEEHIQPDRHGDIIDVEFYIVS